LSSRSKSNTIKFLNGLAFKEFIQGTTKVNSITASPPEHSRHILKFQGISAVLQIFSHASKFLFRRKDE
jgi:hypothetical protein